MTSFREWEGETFETVMTAEFLESWEREGGVVAVPPHTDAATPVTPELFDALATFHLRRRVGKFAKQTGQEQSEEILIEKRAAAAERRGGRSRA